MKRAVVICLMFLLLQVGAWAGKSVVPSTGTYTLAILPVVNLSNLDQKIAGVAGNAIHESLEKKYPAKKSKIQFVSNEAINAFLATQPFENPEAPTLEEMVNAGKHLGADRVIFISLMNVNDKESGFMVMVGAGTIRANVTLKQKCVDVREHKFLYNDNTVAKGASNSVNFWKIGSPSKLRAVKKGVKEAMKQFLTSFD